MDYQYYQNILNKFGNYLVNRGEFTPIIDALNTSFPDRWDISYSLSPPFKNKLDDKTDMSIITEFGLTTAVKNNFYVRFIIHFPDIIISNGTNTHNIKDLYVGFYFLRRDGYHHFNGIDGIRGSLSLRELRSNYGHSHLSGSPMRWNIFCTGSGPINQILNHRENSLEIRDYNYWMFFLNLLNQYVRWESVSGRPYRYISDLGIGGELLDLSYTNCVNIMKKYGFLKRFKNIPIKFSNNRIEVIFSETLEKDICYNIKESGIYIYNNDLLCYKNAEGNYYNKNTVGNDSYVEDYNNYKLPLIFKGEQKYLKINNTNINERYNYTENAPNPSFSKHFCEYFGRKLTKAYLERSRIAKENFSEDSKECVSEDKVFMQ